MPYVTMRVIDFLRNKKELICQKVSACPFDDLDLVLDFRVLFAGKKNLAVETPLLASNHCGGNKEVGDIKWIPMSIVGKFVFEYMVNTDMVDQL